MGSWGAEPPSWVSRNTGGRKSKSKSKRKPLPKSVSQYTFTKTKYVTVLATNLEEAEAIAKAGGGNESRFPKFDLYSSSSILPRETDDE